jgi:hypothetical protein
MGVTGSGKSTFISLLADQSVEVGHSLTSCMYGTISKVMPTDQEAGTTEVGVYSFKYTENRTVYLIDTPGFDDTTRSDTDVLKDVAFFLSTIYTNKVHLAGIIYLHRITDPRMQGSALKNLHMFQKLCGDRGLSSVILATTMWATLEASEEGQEIGRKRELELQRPEFWGTMIKRGSEIVKHEGTAESARTIISHLVEKDARVVLDIQVQLVDDGKTLDETAAGQYVQKELLEARKKFERDIADYQESMEVALQEKDEELLQTLKAEKAAAEAREAEREKDRQNLRITLRQLQEEKDKQYQTLVQKLEQNQRLAQQSSETLSSERQMIESHIRELHQALKDGDQRHRAEIARLQQSQQSQTVAEIQRIQKMMFEREQIWREKERGLQRELERERRLRERDDFRGINPIILFLRQITEPAAAGLSVISRRSNSWGSEGRR